MYSPFDMLHNFFFTHISIFFTVNCKFLLSSLVLNFQLWGRSTFLGWKICINFFFFKCLRLDHLSTYVCSTINQYPLKFVFYFLIAILYKIVKYLLLNKVAQVPDLFRWRNLTSFTRLWLGDIEPWKGALGDRCRFYDPINSSYVILPWI